MRILNIFIFISIFGIVSITKGQKNISFKLLSITTNQFENRNSSIYKSKLTDNGKFTFEPGILFTYEVYANQNSALKINQALYNDRCSKLAGFSQILVKFRLGRIWKHSFSIGIGPILHYRKDWSDIEGYQDENLYKVWSDWQQRFSWISGEFEYDFYLNKKGDLSISINHIHAEGISLAIGYRHWISKKSKKKRGCVSCPLFK